MKKIFISLLCAMLCAIGVVAQDSPAQWRRLNGNTSLEFLRSDDARQLAAVVLAYQRITGGWPKNINYAQPPGDDPIATARAGYERTDDSTTDNGATNAEIIFLARMYNANGNPAYLSAVERGVEYLLSGQYANGGWPQFWPDPKGYAVHITYNDNAMINTMRLLRDVRDGNEPFACLSDADLHRRVTDALDRAVECILNTQIVHDGQLTIWCQQHYSDTMLPAPARAFELASFTPSESTAILKYLMEIENPSDRVKASIHAGIAWLDRYKLTGLRVVRTYNEREGKNTMLVDDPEGHPLWARYYDLEDCQPFVCDRDGIPRRHLYEIGFERRSGYSWFNASPVENHLFEHYDEWAAKYDPEHKVAWDLNAPGANKTGLVDFDRKITVDPAAFDCVVYPGMSINAAIASAPADGSRYTIFIKKGLYPEKVVIDRPNIVLVGEDRDSVRIVYAEGRNTPKTLDADGKELRGTVCLTERAADCIIASLTVYNNYGTTVEATTSHQFALFGRAPRTIVLNSNIHSDGNDALALWAKGDDAMYYHADLDLRCAGVDFLCPRGWCYATRCHFHGDGHAMIWHDGTGNPDKKLVITNSTFDALRPTALGRFHHDAQIYVLNSRMSADVLDQDIAYAYTDRPDPSEWGRRIYYWGNIREGGDSGWLENNLSTAPGSPPFHALTARWTFDRRWDPEAVMRDLWPILKY